MLNRNAYTQTYTGPVHTNTMFVTDAQDHYFNGKYVMLLYGVHANSKKAVCVVNGIRPYFDLQILDTTFNKYICSDINDGEFGNVEKTKIYLHQFMGYNPVKLPYYRCYFNTLWDRKKWITYFMSNTYKGKPYVLASNDLSSYYRKFAREHNFRLNTWIRLVNCENSVCYRQYFTYDTVYSINYANIEFTNIPQDLKYILPHIIVTWDIETYADTVGLPNPDDNNAVIFLISFVVYNSTACVKKYLLSTLELPVVHDCNKDVSIHYCSNEQQLVMMFIKLLTIWQPEIICGFNCGNYDWPFIFSKIRKYKLEKVMRQLCPLKKDNWQFEKTEIVKVDRATEIRYLQMHNILCMDMRIHCMKSVISEKSSLEFYLQYFGLPPKDDMPISRMRELYLNPTTSIDDLNNMFHYCLIDAVRCYDLFSKNNILHAIKEEANLVYMSPIDVYLRANGVKIRNLIMSYGDEYAFDVLLKSTETQSYVGAYVVDPVTGLFKDGNDTPIAAVDFSSLYPNLMISYNLSPECIMFTKQSSYDTNKYDLLDISFEYDGATVNGWCLKYKNVNDMGITPKMLLDLYTKRMAVKTKLAKYEKMREAYLSGKPIEINGIKNVYDYIQFNCKYYNAKQLCLKQKLNTTYGDFGSNLSPFYMRQLAGAVTCLGRTNLQFVIDYVRNEKHCKVIYGDTDSVYFMMPLYYYKHIIHDYNTGNIDKQTYWNRLITTAIEKAKEIGRDINTTLVQRNNGLSFLRVEYEGCLYPAYFIEKKHYLGIQHVSEPNLTASLTDNLDEFIKHPSLLIKGVKVKKRGTDKYAQHIIYSLLYKLMSIDDTYDYVTYIENALQKLPEYTLDVSYYVKTAKYNHTESGSSFIETFINRIKVNSHMYAVFPNYGDRFEYYIRNVSTHNIKGYKNTVNASDMMELYVPGVTAITDINTRYYIENVYSLASKFLVRSPKYADRSCDQIKKTLIKLFLPSYEKSHNQIKYFKSNIKTKLLCENIVTCKSQKDILAIWKRYIKTYTDDMVTLIINYIKDNHEKIILAIRALEQNPETFTDYNTLNLLFEYSDAEFGIPKKVARVYAIKKNLRLKKIIDLSTS